MDKSNLKDLAYRTIKNRIVECVYLPGNFLRDVDLVEELGISRTPIREAIGRLEQENFVKLIPQRGVMVQGVGYREISDIFQVRIIIEPYILRSYREQIDPQRVLTLKDGFLKAKADGDEASKYRLDDELHAYFRSLCPNKYLMDLLDNIYDQNHRLRILCGKSKSRLEDSVDEHIAILDLILDGQIVEAADSLERHIQNSRTSAIDLFISGH
ncbi:MAG TPA: GntR family transcriptional regulator [Rectinemataceae bacterium]|nr:GntR family transcriptional regulator [Rectinemataceae bacterium]